ncbi:MAG TPA: class I SAM-dependent methyltransferase [Spirochaetota bacterium]|nr:class I SAM-dependent methyltransferase [Spirochaetota bacterium]
MNKKMVKKTGTNCIVCGTPGRVEFTGLNDVLFNVPGKWDLAMCPECRLFWIHPTPTGKEIAAFYNSYHTHDEFDENEWIVRVICRGIPVVSMGYVNIMITRSERFWGFIFSLFGPMREAGKGAILWLHARERGKLLDVGCGSGIFLRRLGFLGWDTYGIEFDSSAAIHASKNMQPGRVFIGKIEDYNENTRSFDVITMIHVIEHLAEPVAALEKCYELLRPGGKLIVSTPNSRSLGARVFGKFWRGWEPPRHLYVYNPENLSKLVSSAGFLIQEVFTPANASVIVWNESFRVLWMNKGIYEPGFLRKAFKGISSLSMWLFEYLVTRFGSGCGEVIHLVAVKSPIEKR